MKKTGIFFCTFFIALFLSIATFWVVVNFCGRGITEQSWFLDLYPLKNHFAKEKTGQKIIIVGGSSSFLGINGERLREYTGMDNINLSMSVMFPMRFYLVDLEKYVKKGDIVVLLMELTNHFNETAEKNFSNFGISLLFGCNPAAQKTLSPLELCSLYFQYGFSWINSSLFHQQGLLYRLCMRQKQDLFDGYYKEERVFGKWKQLHGKRNRHGAPDYHYDLSVYGDWMIDQEPRETDIAPFPLSNSISDEFVYCYNRIRKLTQERQAVLLLVWPNCYFYAEQTGFSKFAGLLKAKGIDIHGRPEAMSFPKYFYHDPIHHMNESGAELWSYELAKTICRATGRPVKKVRNWPYVVFADDPTLYFPGVKSARVYDTGVQISQKSFPMTLDIPEKLRGKPLELDLIAKNFSPRKKVFNRITVSGEPLVSREYASLERANVFVEIPQKHTGKKTLELLCSVNGESVGMERVFIRKKTWTISFRSGFSCAEPWGRWTDGGKAELVLNVPPAYRRKKLKTTWDILAFVHKKKPECQVVIYAGQRKLMERTFTKFNEKFTLDIPAKYTRTSQLALTIQIRNPVSSKTLGISDDPRKLGIGIKNISMEPVSPDAESSGSEK